MIVTADATRTKQVQRVIDRDHVTEADARQRLATQLPVMDKVRGADYVIRTDGTHEETDRSVRDVYERLMATAR